MAGWRGKSSEPKKSSLTLPSLLVDVQGAATVKRMMPEVVTVFLAAESEEALVKRLAARKTEPLDKLLVRVATARQEMACMRQFDYVVVNAEGQQERAAAMLASIIDAEKAKSSRRGLPPPS